eukprot:scaffold7548_cov126-Isochrysis_galbana.AAC.10
MNAQCREASRYICRTPHWRLATRCRQGSSGEGSSAPGGHAVLPRLQYTITTIKPVHVGREGCGDLVERKVQLLDVDGLCEAGTGMVRWWCMRDCLRGSASRIHKCRHSMRRCLAALEKRGA